MKRKNLDDLLSNDRSVVRAAKYKKSWKGSYAVTPKCASGHPPLKISYEGVEYEIFGGTCISPYVTDADIYIGFDMGMSMTARSYPWNEGHEVLFPIQDMGVPKNVKEFRNLLQWTKDNLVAGKKIHCGCIGGHGRTGTFLAALVREMEGIEDAITHVRENYCKKAVESKSQIEWLHEHFGIKEVEATKTYDSWNSGSTKGWGKSIPVVKGVPTKTKEPTIHPMGVAYSIFRD